MKFEHLLPRNICLVQCLPKYTGCSRMREKKYIKTLLDKNKKCWYQEFCPLNVFNTSNLTCAFNFSSLHRTSLYIKECRFENQPGVSIDMRT